jgi:hypothetical protein
MLRRSLGGWFITLFVLVGGCRWSDVPKNVIYACSKGTCPSGQDCQNGFCVTVPVVESDAGNIDAGLVDGGCQPLTCGALGKNCGDLSDACGSMLHCGVCNSPTSCGGAGIANVCGCTPATESDPEVCADAGVTCGTISRLDSCGAMALHTCGGACSCTGLPSTFYCSDAGFNCGPMAITDNCGRAQVFSCGSCSADNSCVTGDLGGGTCMACDPEDDFTFCNRQGANCGELKASDNCGSTRDVDCGGCEDGGCGSNGISNQCSCQPNLMGCASKDQCCSGTCGGGGLCCSAPGHACIDDSDCCLGACSQNFCELTSQ